MEPKKLTEATTKQLLISYKELAKDCHYEMEAWLIYEEIEKRTSANYLYGIRLGLWHLQTGKGDTEFNDEIDKLIKNKP